MLKRKFKPNPLIKFNKEIFIEHGLFKDWIPTSEATVICIA